MLRLILAGLRGFLMSQQKYRDLHSQFKVPIVQRLLICLSRFVDFHFVVKFEAAPRRVGGHEDIPMIMLPNKLKWNY